MRSVGIPLLVRSGLRTMRKRSPPTNDSWSGAWLIQGWSSSKLDIEFHTAPGLSSRSSASWICLEVSELSIFSLNNTDLSRIAQPNLQIRCRHVLQDLSPHMAQERQIRQTCYQHAGQQTIAISGAKPIMLINPKGVPAHVAPHPSLSPLRFRWVH